MQPKSLYGLMFTVFAMIVSLPAQALPGIQSAYVVLGSDQTSVARVITTATVCPDIRIDGKRQSMQVRAPATTEPLRPTASAPENSKPSVFDVTTCEAFLPQGTKSAILAGHNLPVRKARIDRIVVIGDTGCRMKAADNAYQACNDPNAYPFAQIARLAAAWKPDAVVHVGDYEYRETPCPQGNDGCANSPWGYGWDAWNADFFTPAAPLLQTAPLILARGNHESCTRAGQGWWRFLDPRGLQTGRDCNDAAQDVTGDYSAPYAVSFGGGAQIVVMDLSHLGAKAIDAADPRFAQYSETYDRLAQMAAKARFTFAVDHYPILGVTADEKTHKILPGNPAIRSVFGARGQPVLPPRVNVLLAGHVHLWQQVSYASPHPTQFVAGFSGTLEDAPALPDTLPADVSPAPGAIIDQFSSRTGGFGYMTLERLKTNVWQVKVWNSAGHIINRCLITGHTSKCAVARVSADVK